MKLNPKTIIWTAVSTIALVLVLYFASGALESYLSLGSTIDSINSLKSQGSFLEKLVSEQNYMTSGISNILRKAIVYAVVSGISADTIVLLLLLPVVAAFIAAVRHIVGLRGFGILLPAALSVVFVSIGPIVGIGLFLLIITVSTSMRFFLRSAKIRLQYLPRMSLLVWAVCLVVLGLLFMAPVFGSHSFSSVSIFPVLILVLLSEDFTRVQLGKNVKAAVKITAETLLLALFSYLILTSNSLQVFAVQKPEILVLSVALINYAVGKYVGLRFMEYWRFRKLIRSK